jgi:hypothetical protein
MTTADPLSKILERQELVDVVRLLARGYSNEEIASMLAMPNWLVRRHVHDLYLLLRLNRGAGYSPSIARCRTAAWAYETGLLTPGKPAELLTAGPEDVPAPGEAPAFLPETVARPILEALLAVYQDRPRGDLRKVAEAGLRAAGWLPRTGQRPPQP